MKGLAKWLQKYSLWTHNADTTMIQRGQVHMLIPATTTTKSWGWGGGVHIGFSADPIDVGVRIGIGIDISYPR